jgi:hypothetical protein
VRGVGEGRGYLCMDGRYVTRGTRHFAHVSRCFARFTQGITHVSRMFRACFAMFRGITQDSLMIRGFAMIRDILHTVSRTFREIPQGITHVSRMFRACFEGVKNGESECASHTGRP